jgi:general secretion pathway protein D
MAWLLCLAAAWVQDPPAKNERRGGFLQDVNLQDLTVHVQKATGKTFFWAEDLGLRQKRANFATDREIGDDPALLFEAFRLILRANQLILVPAGGEGKETYKIAAAPAGAREPVPVARGALAPEERFVTRLFTLQHASPRNVYPVLASLASSPQNVVAVEESGIVLATDYASNLRRLEEVVKALDVKKPDLEMKVVPLKNASAAKVEEKMKLLAQALLGRPGGRGPAGVPGLPGGETVTVVSDDRINAVVLLAEPGRLAQLEEIARRLDAETPYEASGIHFAPLRHRNARDVADTLNALYGVGPAGIPAPSRPGPATVPPPVPLGPALPAAPLTEGRPVIVSDEATNAIIVITDRTTFRALEPIIRRLDKRRPQVHIKATVVEIAAREDFDLGVELARLEDPKNRFVVGGKTSFALSGFTADPAAGVFTITPVLSSGATLLGMRDRAGNIPALLRALEGRAKVSIIDEPEATTSDNNGATLTAASEVPVPQTTFPGQNPGFAQAGFELLAATTTLSISPHISEAGYLRLETTVRVQKFTPSTSPNLPPGRGTREITTREVLVPSGGTMVIGGIVTSDQSSSVEGVPVLSHVPLLGWLFRREREVRERRTLYIFITPTILYDHAFGDYEGLSRDRKEGVERLRGEPLRGLHVGPPSARLPESTFRFQALRER